jgi:DNA-binding CsgD family transcriptional regulator
MSRHAQANGTAIGGQRGEMTAVPLPWWRFTGYERDIALLHAQGNSADVIADRLGMNAATVTITLIDLERRLAKRDVH